MAGSTSVPQIQFTPVGVVLPSDADILAGVQVDMNAAFGGNLNPSMSTPQGQLATSYAAILAAKDAAFAKFVNQVDPSTADGFMQDAIGRIYFLTRRPAVATVAQVTCSGLVGVAIPVGALVRDADNNIYSCTQAGTIGASGAVVLPFAAVVPGPTACPAGAISGAPYRAILGWDRATNTTAGAVGALVENRAEFEFRRQQSVAKNGKGSLPSIYGNVFDVAGVVDAYVAENVTDAPLAVGSTGYSMLPHSIYVAVVGGTDAAVATAIWQRKDAGANYNGNTTVTVQDTSGYSNPVPSYSVKFQRPTDTPLYFTVNVQNLGSQNSGVLTLAIQKAIVDAFVGADGGQRARIGSTVFASRYFVAIASAGQLAILSVTVGKSPSPTGASVTMGIDENPTIAAANIAVIYS